MGICGISERNQTVQLERQSNIKLVQSLKNRVIDPSVSQFQIEQLMHHIFLESYVLYNKDVSSQIDKDSFLTKSQFSQVIQTTHKKWIRYWLEQFLPGCVGANVPYQTILDAFPYIKKDLHINDPMLKFKHELLSLEFCCNIKRQLIEEDLINKGKPNDKIINKYNKTAKGTFKHQGMVDLTRILKYRQQKSRQDNLLEFLESQEQSLRQYIFNCRQQAIKQIQKNQKEALYKKLLTSEHSDDNVIKLIKVEQSLEIEKNLDVNNKFYQFSAYNKSQEEKDFQIGLKPSNNDLLSLQSTLKSPPSIIPPKEEKSGFGQKADSEINIVN